MIAISLAVICGAALALWGNTVIDSFWISYLPLVLLLAWLLPGLRLVALCLSAMLWSSLLLNQVLEHQLSEDFDNRIVLVQGTVTDIVEQRRHSIRFYFRPDFIEDYQQEMPKLIRLSWYRDKQRPEAGQRWQLQVKLRQPYGFQNPGGFDYERWLFVKGIGATGYVRKSTHNRQLSNSRWYQVDSLRQKIVQAQDNACADCEYLGLFKALTVGYRGDIPPDQGQLLRDTGTAHLLAISGLHIGLVAGQFYLLGGFLWRRLLHRSKFNRLEVSSFTAMIAALGYSALAGFSIPTVRALVMLLVIFLALLCRKHVNLLNSISLAVIVILLANPSAVGDTSFWLSFSALLVIAFGQFLMTDQKGYLKQALIIQVLFSLLFIPLSILLFNQASPAGFLANIIAIPALGLLILPLTLLASLFAVLDISALGWLFSLVDKLTGWLIDYLQFLQTSVQPGLSFAQRPVIVLVSLAIAIFILLLPLSWRARLPAVVLFVVAICWQPGSVPANSFRMTLLDVGMGTSVVIETRHHSLVYDFGPGSADGFSAGAWVVRPYLQYRGIENPDMMIVSHIDSDHSGGLISFMDEIDTVPLVSGTPQSLKERFGLKTAIPLCHRFAPWRWDGVDFEFIAGPLSLLSNSTNNQSCVLRVSAEHSVLLSGDIEAAQEASLINHHESNLAADVLLAPHHGSLSSSTQSFIDAVDAGSVIFTMGRSNRWGFPRPEVVSRYAESGSRIYRSDRDGAITILSTPDNLQIDRWRKSNRIWQ